MDWNPTNYQFAWQVVDEYNGDTFDQDSESYRVLAIQPGQGPFDSVIEAEWLGSSGASELGANA